MLASSAETEFTQQFARTEAAEELVSQEWEWELNSRKSDLAWSRAQMAGFGEALGLPFSSRHSSNLTSHRLAADVLAGAVRGACVRYSAMKHSSARYQYDVCESPISLCDK
jgi:hypothetical protein